MPEPFLERLDREVLVGDGAMGTELYARGIDLAACFDALNLTDPDMVAAVHKSYIEAGADLIETNTFGANRVRLAQFGLETRAREINLAGSELARRQAGGRVYVAGSIGPFEGRWGEEEFTVDQIRDIFREQVKALVDGGVDLLIFETFSSLTHLLEGLTVAREETGGKLPVICQLAFIEGGRTAAGIVDITAAKELASAGADVIGANCISGPIRTLEVIERMALAVSSRLSASPNAGAPTFVNGRYIYASTSEYMAEYARRMVDAGVALVGGCCGTTPADIRAIVKRLGADRAVRPRRLSPAAVSVAAPSGGGGRAPLPKFLADLPRRKFITVELDPPKGMDTSGLMKTAKALAKEGGVDVFNLAENTMGTPRLSNIAMAHILQQETGVETLVHITCRDRNLIGLQSALMGAWALGIRHLLALTGDPAKIGPQPGATSVYDTQSFGLVDLIRKLNEGTNAIGNPIGKPTGFSIGVAFDPHGKKIEPQVNRLRRKVRLGAQYALSQPVYSVEKAVELYDKTADVGVPVFLGVMPLVSEKNAEYLHNEVPGISIPDDVRRQMHGLSGPAGRARGLALARGLVEELFSRASGFYIIPVFNHVEIALEMVRFVRSCEAKSLRSAPV